MENIFPFLGTHEAGSNISVNVLANIFYLDMSVSCLSIMLIMYRLTVMSLECTILNEES